MWYTDTSHNYVKHNTHTYFFYTINFSLSPVYTSSKVIFSKRKLSSSIRLMRDHIEFQSKYACVEKNKERFTHNCFKHIRKYRYVSNWIMCHFDVDWLGRFLVEECRGVSRYIISVSRTQFPWIDRHWLQQRINTHVPVFCLRFYSTFDAIHFVTKLICGLLKYDHRLIWASSRQLSTL